MSEHLGYESKLDPTEPPGALRAVAWVNIAFGILAVISMVAELFAGRVSINLGFLGIFIGRGLLHYSKGWRACALVFIWIAMIASAIPVVLGVLGGADVTIFGQRVRGISAVIGALVIGGGFFALALWEYRVLTRPDIRRLFGLREAPPA